MGISQEKELLLKSNLKIKIKRSFPPSKINQNSNLASKLEIKRFNNLMNFTNQINWLLDLNHENILLK